MGRIAKSSAPITERKNRCPRSSSPAVSSPIKGSSAPASHAYSGPARAYTLHAQSLAVLDLGRANPPDMCSKLERTRPGNTELVGYKSGSEFANLLRQADIFCCPSIWDDPFPLAPLEAMAAGLPVVASRTGGIPEALAYGGGLLVPPNDVVALAAALQKLIVAFPIGRSSRVKP